MSRKLQLKGILKLICQQQVLHVMMMIFSALWIQQEDRQQVLQWLEEFMESKSTSLLSLKDYPHHCQRLVKANSTLRSSAAVERLSALLE